ncbi:NfeD family protein [Chloroflexota bacterium]
MTGRLVLAIISTLLEETAIVAIVLLWLPKIGINIPVVGLIALMTAWGTYSVVTYRIGSRALRRKPMISLPDMIGSKGKVISPLAPEGLVKIKGELWIAKADSSEMEPGTEVTVVTQERLKLVVRESGSTNNLEKTE